MRENTLLKKNCAKTSVGKRVEAGESSTVESPCCSDRDPIRFLEHGVAHNNLQLHLQGKHAGRQRAYAQE